MWRCLTAYFVCSLQDLQCGSTAISSICAQLGDPGRLTASLAESICIRGGIKPATFPLKVSQTQFVMATPFAYMVHVAPRYSIE